MVGDKRDRKQLQNETVFFRIVNHTVRCESPRIVIFEGRPLEQEWMPVPPAWISELDHTVHLIISKGTLVPAASDQQMAGLVHHMPQPASLLPSPAQSPQLSVPLPHFASPLGSPSAQLMTGYGAGCLDHLRRLDKIVRGKKGSSPLHVGQGLPLPPRPPVPTMAQPMHPSPPPMVISPPTMLAPSPASRGVADGWTSRAPAFVSLPGSMPGRRSTLAFQRTPGATIPASFQPTFQPPASAALPVNFPDSLGSNPLGLPGLSEFEIQVLQKTLQADMALSRALAGKTGNEPVLCLPLPLAHSIENLDVDAPLPSGIRQTQRYRVQPADAFASLNPQHLLPPASALSSSDLQHRVQPADALSSKLWADCPPVLLGRSVALMRPNQFDQKCPAGKEAGGAPPQVEQVDGSGRALAAAHLWPPLCAALISAKSRHLAGLLV